MDYNKETYQLLLLWGGDIDMPHADKDYSMTHAIHVGLSRRT